MITSTRAFTSIETTSNATEVDAKIQQDWMMSLRQRSNEMQASLGTKISTSFASFSVQSAWTMLDKRGGLSLRNITKPRQLLQNISMKSVNWAMTTSTSNAFGKIYADVNNGNASVDLRSQIGRINVSNINPANIQKMKLNITTNRLDILAHQVYGSAKFWWLVRCSNIKTYGSPSSKMRAGAELNFVNKSTALNVLAES